MFNSDIQRKLHVTNFFGENLTVIYLKKEKIIELQKTWGKEIIDIDNQSLEKILLSLKSPYDHFYCSDSDPMLIWITVPLSSGYFRCTTEIYSVYKFYFDKLINDFIFAKKTIKWKNLGF